jgi:hypothetical protein
MCLVSMDISCPLNQHYMIPDSIIKELADVNGVTSQKTVMFILAVVTASNVVMLTPFILPPFSLSFVSLLPLFHCSSHFQNPCTQCNFKDLVCLHTKGHGVCSVAIPQAAAEL